MPGARKNRTKGNVKVPWPYPCVVCLCVLYACPGVSVPVHVCVCVCVSRHHGCVTVKILLLCFRLSCSRRKTNTWYNNDCLVLSQGEHAVIFYVWHTDCFDIILLRSLYNMLLFSSSYCFYSRFIVFFRTKQLVISTFY